MTESVKEFVGKKLIETYNLTGYTPEQVCEKELIPAEKRNNGLRQYNWICTESYFKILKKEELLEKLFSDIKEKFVFNVSDSHKKATINYAIINEANQPCIRVTTDFLGIVLVDKKEVLKYLDVIQDWYSVKQSGKVALQTFFTKKEIKESCLNTKKIEDYGESRFFKEDKILKNFRNTLCFELIVSLLNIKNI